MLVIFMINMCHVTNIKKNKNTNFSRFLSGVTLAPFLSFTILVEFLPFRSLLNDSLNDFLNDFLLEIGLSPAVDKSKYK